MPYRKGSTGSSSPCSPSIFWAPYGSREQPSADPKPASALILDFQRANFCSLQITLSRAFCYSSTNRSRQMVCLLSCSRGVMAAVFWNGGLHLASSLLKWSAKASRGEGWVLGSTSLFLLLATSHLTPWGQQESSDLASVDVLLGVRCP